MKTYQTRCISGVVLDWAGTTVDFGCRTQIKALTSTFAKRGISITTAEARAYLSYSTEDIFTRIFHLDRVRRLWRHSFGASPTQADRNTLARDYEEMLIQYLPENTKLLPGVLELCSELRSRRIRIGSCSSYPCEILNLLSELAARKGYMPDSLVSCDDLPDGKPYPWMAYLNAIALEVYPMHAMIYVGDTVYDMQAARNANMWAVGVVMGGNTLGLSLDDFSGLNNKTLQERMISARERLFDAGAHYVINTIMDLIPVIDEIDHRMRTQPTPWFAPFISYDDDVLSNHPHELPMSA